MTSSNRKGRARPAHHTAPITTPLEQVREQATVELALLTANERDVLVMLAKGFMSKQIAEQLGKSVKTVEAQRYSLTKRLGMNCIEAAVTAAKAGWV